ncbi:MAG: hypothetical protein ABI208_01695 [Ginsengibacter sp.]|jgi:hypothetical protein
MKKIFQFILVASLSLAIASCSTSKDTATKGNLSGNWVITDIQVNIPNDFKVVNVFDEAPYQDFKGSTWNLVRNGNGSFTLPNGKKEDIYWSINGKGNDAIFQFKKLNGEKAKNVTEGYLLPVGSVSATQFTLNSPVLLADGTTKNITYTFTKQ